jgi:hypothetical protein
MASIDREREKIQSPQNSVKLASSQRVRHNISNDVNGVTDQNISAVKFLVNLAQSTEMSQHRTTDVIINTDDVNIHTVYVAHTKHDMCHADIIMVM